MTLIVEMVRGTPGEPGFAFYGCAKQSWEQALSIAQQFGWKPRGTVPDPLATRSVDYDKHFVPDYSPSDWAYCKRVDDDDASALAFSLIQACAALRQDGVSEGDTLLLGDGMTEEVYLQVNAKTIEKFESLARYCHAGGFAFAWDD